MWHQARDFELLEDFFASRLISLPQTAKLYFDGRSETAKKHIQKLKQAGYIGERERKVNERSILFLTKLGFQLLRDQGHLARYPHLSEAVFEKRMDVAPSTVAHELAVMDVKAALVPTLKRQFDAVECSTWPRLHQFNVFHPRIRAPKTIKPDGFLQVGESGGRHHFYLEVDRSTESLTVLLDKALAYGAHYRNGGFAASQGAPRTDFALHPFRVLFVVKSPERRDNLARHLLENHILTQTWITTQDEVCNDPLGKIWVRPADYRNVSNPMHGVCYVEKYPLFPSSVRPELN